MPRIMLPDASLTAPTADCPPPCDCHFHVFGANERAPDARYVPAYAATLADWRAAALASNVTRGVVVQPSFLGTDNRLLLQALAALPDDLRGVAVVDTAIDRGALADLYARGVRAVRLNVMGMSDDMSSIRALRTAWWSAVGEAGLHVELHSDVGRMAALLPHVPQDITVVLDHFAKPHAASLYDETVRAVSHRLKSNGNTFITLSGAYRQGAETPKANERLARSLAAMWLEIAGRERLLWGSDWPCTNHEAQADRVSVSNTLDQWLPAASDQLAVLHANPHRLYWR